MWVGDRLVHMTKKERTGYTGSFTTTEKMHFHYNGQGKPAMLMYNGTRFGYQYNAQGDVIGIITGGHSEIVKYTYDAWGKLLSITGSGKDDIGKANPFRYRAYVYDQECGLYYLRTRYYNPNLGRFICADKKLQDNLFMYCHNKVVSYSDAEGTKEEYAGYDNETYHSYISLGVQIEGLLPNAVYHYFSARGDDMYIWTDESGKAIHSRHYSNHGNEKIHPFVPHDHNWHDKDDGSGKREQDKKCLPPDDSYSEEGAIQMKIQRDASDATVITAIGEAVLFIMLAGASLLMGVPLYQMAPAL